MPRIVTVCVVLSPFDRHWGEHERREEHEREEGLASLDVGQQGRQQEAEPGLEHDRYPGEQDRVQQAAVEDEISEDRSHVVVESDEGRQGETLRLMQAEHDSVDERVEQEPGQDDQGRREEQQVDGAVAS